MSLPDLEAWAVYAAVAEHRSFSAAAQSLGVSKATVSKAVARLEARLGLTLLHRTSRRLSLTEGGALLAERAARIVAEATCAEEIARDAATALSGRIRLAAPMSFGVARVAPLVADFLAAHPGVEVALDLSDARVDIVAGGFDLALRIADLPNSSLRARRLCAIQSHLVAAPAYLAAHSAPAHPAELGAHRLLRYANAGGPWLFRSAAGEEASVPAAGPLLANNGDALMPALLAGLGIARLPAFILGDALADGRLVELLPDWRSAPIGLHLVTPPGALRPARVEALIAFLAEQLRD